MKRIFILIFSIWVFIESHGQISTKEMPISFRSDITSAIAGVSVDLKTMSPLDMDRINLEDLQEEKAGVPPRFGFLHKVNFDLENSGTWTTLNNGDKLWQLNIYCPNALSINLLYEKFWIPEKAKFFVYSEKNKQVLGAFTSVNNKGEKSNIQGFATGLVYGDKITLEYYQPSEIKEQSTISIAYIVQGYRYIKLPERDAKSFGGSGDCQVNINCSEGQNWQNEKNSVALILVNGNRYCTGSLINTTANDNRPLFLTADHCLGGWANDLKYDAISSPNLNHWSFYWNYESPSCSNLYEPSIKSTVGATVLANNSISDFALLRLEENPRDEAGITTYYLGWDNSGNSGTGGVGIHHPSGDVKKIATLNGSTNSNWNGDINFWSHYWDQTTHGYSVTEGGSSGSPLINSSRHLIGQLYGGSDLDCSNPSQDIAAYGKFSVSWTGNGATDNRRRLRDWLDPCNSEVTTLDGVHSFSISGQSLVCNSGAPFTINNPPAVDSIIWTYGPGLTINSGQYTSTCTFSSISSGSSWVRARLVTSCGGTTLPQYPVWTGTPVLTISGPSSGYINNTYNFYINSVSSYYSSEWSVNPSYGNYLYPQSTYAFISFVEANRYDVIARATNACGLGDYAWKTIYIFDNYQGYTLFPNPASDNVTITMNENQPLVTTNESDITNVDMTNTNADERTIYTIRVYNSQSTMLSSVTRTGKSFTIPLNNLHDGIYILEVRDAKNSYRKQLIVKHN